MKIVALDFETADRKPDSACALAMVAIENGTIVDQTNILIRPPRQAFDFTYIHGITWADVRSEPTFAEHIPKIDEFLRDASYLVAHYAPFDRKVLYNCYEVSGRDYPQVPFSCTVRLARSAWQVFPTKLPDVCNHLKIPLNHHDALSDALACAQIAIASQRAGVSIKEGLLGRHTYTLLPLASAARSPSAAARRTATRKATGQQPSSGAPLSKRRAGPGEPGQETPPVREREEPVRIRVNEPAREPKKGHTALLVIFLLMALLFIFLAV